MRAGVAIGAGVCCLVALGITLKPLRWTRSAPPSASSGDAPSRVVSGRAATTWATGARVSEGGWIAQPRERSVPPPAVNRVAGGPPSVAHRSIAAARAPVDRRAAAAVDRGADDAAPGRRPDGSQPIGADASGAATHGAPPQAATGQAPSGAAPTTTGSLPQPAGLEPGAPAADLTQPPGGSTLVYQNAANKDLPLDQLLHIDAANFVGRDTGAVSFVVQPYWEAGDPTTATLVQLGSSDTNPSGFAITKNGQALEFTFTDTSGGAPFTTSLPIDGWQPGEPHLVTASWGQSPTGGQTVASLSVDGQLVGQQPYHGQFQIGPGVPLNIGSGYGNAAQTVPGVLTNFKVYNQAP